MLPPFDEYGNLPRGIHRASMNEVIERFGHGSPERKVETSELIQFVEWCRRSGIARLIVNGSYVTAAEAPNDVDIVVLPGLAYPRGESVVGKEETLFPFLQVLVAADLQDLESWAFGDFGTDREMRPKGVVEILL